MKLQQSKYIRWFEDLGANDVSLVGGKNANLGELYRTLKGKRITVPNGFAITSDAYSDFIRLNHLEQRIQELQIQSEKKDSKQLQQQSAEIRKLIMSAKLQDELLLAIKNSYQKLNHRDIAVRSSATAEDLPTASFAGQQDSYLNIQGETELIENVLKCYASLFNDRAISYRTERGYDHRKVLLSVTVQEMVRSDKGSSGIIFTVDTETGFEDVVVISASYGLGENIVQGKVNPDEYLVFKPTLHAGFAPVIKRKVGTKETKLIYDPEKEGRTINVDVSPEDRKKIVLNESEILELARSACFIEQHYSKRNGKHTPMDIEWAKDPDTGKVYVVQARPETVQSQRISQTDIVSYKLLQEGKIVITGQSVGQAVVTGHARVIESVSDLENLKVDEILVTNKTDPDWEPVMKRAAAIVTDRGGRTCHAAIVARELGIPAVVGTGNGTLTIQTGQRITLSSAQGDTGYIYDGFLHYERELTHLKDIPQTKTKIMLNIAHPEEAFRLSFLPNSGVGLARIEFIINSGIGIHPMALVHFNELKNAEAKKQIEVLTYPYLNKPQYFVEKLSEQTALIASAFYPKDVIVRLSDFKSNEYAHLIGGNEFEPIEENPMLGFRGAFRYSHPQYREGFALECAAMKRAREHMGLKNIKLMIPFCRTLEEARTVLAEMKKNGLVRGVDGLEIYMMCEVPSNVILMKEFCEFFDGFSIGSNDLTQLILGVDRDSEIVMPSFNERDPAVLKALSQAIRAAKASGKKIGICGQAPSDYPDFAEYLVRENIDSISLNADSILKTIPVVNQAETLLHQKGEVYVTQ